MKEVKKIIISIIICICAIMGVGVMVKANTIPDSGTCGLYAQYTIDDSGTLTISGTGEADKLIFQNVEKIKKLIINEGITSIGSDMFLDNYNLEEVVIADTVKKIDSNTFMNCTSLKKVTLSQKLNFLGDDVFDGCTSLKKIKLPKSLKKVGLYLFYGCSSLRKVEMPGDIKVSSTDTSGMFKGCKKVKITISKGTKIIRKNLFSYTKAIISVKLPLGLKKIEKSAFAECGNLKKIDVPLSTKKIGKSAFSSCYKLKNISMPGDIKKADYVFSETPKTKVTIKKGSRYIAAHLFQGANLVSIKIPNTVKTIKEYAFENNYNLEKVVIPNSVTKIEKSAFEWCYGINTLKLGKGLKVIESRAFANVDAEMHKMNIYYAGSRNRWSKVKKGVANSTFTTHGVKCK